MKTKPFDLKAALAGAKLVTKDGFEVTEFRYTNRSGLFPYEGVKNYASGYTLNVTFKGDGNWMGAEQSHGDLLLVDTSPDHTKPFNLEVALKGEPVVTRDGRAVTDLKRFETVDKVYAALGGYVRGWYLDGRESTYGENSGDLFMAVPGPKVREVWLNLYPNDVAAFNNKDSAEYYGAMHRRLGKVRRVLIPEEE